LANGNLVESLPTVDYQSFRCAPCALEIPAETREGPEELCKAKLVLLAPLLTSQRGPEQDNAWNYVQLLAKTRSFLQFET
jgi:hypothetical protein